MLNTFRKMLQEESLTPGKVWAAEPLLHSFHLLEEFILLFLGGREEGCWMWKEDCLRHRATVECSPLILMLLSRTGFGHEIWLCSQGTSNGISSLSQVLERWSGETVPGLETQASIHTKSALCLHKSVWSWLISAWCLHLNCSLHMWFPGHPSRKLWENVMSS